MSDRLARRLRTRGVDTRVTVNLAYPTILTLHTVGLGMLAGANAVVDFRLLAFAPRLPIAYLSDCRRPPDGFDLRLMGF